MTGTGRAATYLGREDLLERLAAAVGVVADGAGSLVILRGPAGIGTSATAQAVAGVAAAKGFAVRWGGFADGLHDRPYGGLAAALEAHAAAVVVERLAEHLGSGAPSLARLAPALRAQLPGIPPPAPLEPSDERLRLFDSYVGWLRRAAADQPLLLVLDDLQWADADAVMLLEHLLRRTRETPLLVLATWSDQRVAGAGDTGRSAAAGMLRLGRVHDIGGLDKAATGELLTRAAERPVARATLDLVQQATGGQPLAAMELYRLLDEEGHLGRAGGDQLPAVDDLPRRLDEIVAWRIAGLSLESRAAVTAVACFPHAAPSPLLAPVAGLTRTRLAHALDEPLSRGMVKIDASTAAPSYSIAHAAVRRALLNSLEPALLSRAMRRAAEALEAEGATDLHGSAPLLAELYARSALEPAGPGALRHFLIAAEQARAATAFARAAGLLAVAATLMPRIDSTARGDLDRRLLEAHAEAGHADRALEAAERLLTPDAGRGRSSDVRPLVDAARSLRSWGESDALSALVELGWRSLGGRANADRRGLAAARLDLLGERWQAADDEAPVSVLAQIDDTTERLLLTDGDETDRADLFAPARRRTHEQTVALLTMSRDWRRPSSLLVALRGACIDLTTRLGRFREAVAWAAQYLAAAERYGSVADVCRALLLVARCRTLLGDLGAASDALDKADELLVDVEEVDLAEERLLGRFSLAHYRDGDWPALVGAARQQLIRGPQPAGLALTAELALGHARCGDEAAARPAVDTVVAGVERWPPLTYLRDEALLTALSAAWELGWSTHVVRGRALLDQAAAEGIGGNHAATPGLALARLAALAGGLEEARAAFAAERATLEAAGLRPLRAIADHDEAVALAAAERETSAATELLRAAAAAFAELGMDGWLERAERLLDGGFEPALRPGGRLHFTYPAGLSRREVDVVRRVVAGSDIAAAAAGLEIEIEVARRHLDSALAKLGTADPADLPRLARRHGLARGS